MSSTLGRLHPKSYLYTTIVCLRFFRSSHRPGVFSDLSLRLSVVFPVGEGNTKKNLSYWVRVIEVNFPCPSFLNLSTILTQRSLTLLWDSYSLFGDTSCFNPHHSPGYDEKLSFICRRNFLPSRPSSWNLIHGLSWESKVVPPYPHLDPSPTKNLKTRDQKRLLTTETGVYRVRKPRMNP